jgi:hypothetical protein
VWGWKHLEIFLQGSRYALRKVSARKHRLGGVAVLTLGWVWASTCGIHHRRFGAAPAVVLPRRDSGSWWMAWGACAGFLG